MAEALPLVLRIPVAFLEIEHTHCDSLVGLSLQQCRPERSGATPDLVGIHGRGKGGLALRQPSDFHIEKPVNQTSTKGGVA